MNRKQFLRATGAIALAAGSSRPVRAAEPVERELPALIRVGIIGLAGHYSEISNAARSLPAIRVTAVSDPNPETLERAARSSTLASARRFTNHEEMLGRETFDIIGVCGENASRARIVQSCAERKLPIIAEKPLALSLTDLAVVKAAILRHQVPISLLLTMRSSPPYRAMREIVKKGEIGEVVLMDGQKSYQAGARPAWMKSRATFGGTIPYIGIHLLDLMRWISGRDFSQVAAFQSNVGSADLGEMENNASLALKLDNGGSASLRLDYLRPAAAGSHGDDRLRIVGTRGIVEYKQQELTLATDKQAPTIIESLPAARPLFVDFVESIYLGTPHIISREEIFRISEVVLKARDAADTGNVVAL